MTESVAELMSRFARQGTATAPNVAPGSARPIRSGVAGLVLTDVASRPNPDWSGHRESGEVSLLLGFTGPEAVLAVLTGELAARSGHGTIRAQLHGFGFASGASLWTFGFRGEEQAGPTPARSLVAPLDVVDDALHESDDGLAAFHLHLSIQNT